MTNWKNAASLLMAGLIYASFGVWIRLLSKDMTDIQQMMFRYFFAALFALFMIALLKQRIFFSKVKVFPLIAFTVAFPIELYLFVVAALKINLSTMIFAFYGASLVFSLIFGIIIFRERLSRIKVVCMLLTLVGFLFLGYPLSHVLSLGFLAAVISGILDAVTNSARKELSGKVDKFPLILLQSLSSMALMAILLWVNKQTLIPQVSPLSWLISIIFGMLIIAVNYLALIGFKGFDLNLGTVLLSSEMVFTPFIALLMFREMPSTQTIIGGLLIAISIVVVNLANQNRDVKNKLGRKNRGQNAFSKH